MSAATAVECLLIMRQRSGSEKSFKSSEPGAAQLHTGSTTAYCTGSLCSIADNTGSYCRVLCTHAPIVVAAPSANAWRKLDSIIALTDHGGLVEGDPVLDLQHTHAGSNSTPVRSIWLLAHWLNWHMDGGTIWLNMYKGLAVGYRSCRTHHGCRAMVQLGLVEEYTECWCNAWEPCMPDGWLCCIAAAMAGHKQAGERHSDVRTLSPNS